jgi:hypothetical protein
VNLGAQDVFQLITQQAKTRIKALTETLGRPRKAAPYPIWRPISQHLSNAIRQLQVFRELNKFIF